MSFNKWFPNRPEPARPKGRLSPEARAWAFRGAWYASTGMLILGYVLIFAFWNR